MPITWTDDLNTGIGEIDQQHRKIVEYIGLLEVAHQQQNRAMVGKVLDECINYTVSHFAFEENLQQEAGYEFSGPHKKVHELFARRIKEYQQRFENGEDIEQELYTMLSRWLIRHIKHDDADYVDAVKANMVTIIEDKKRSNDKGWFSRFFR